MHNSGYFTHQRIDENNVIKVADFGLCEDVYNTGYFCQNREDAEAREEKLPIRWMAPESIESGRFNEKTDVVGKICAQLKWILCVCVLYCKSTCIGGV